MPRYTEPPFCPVEGVINLRTVGGYLIPSQPGTQVRSDAVFRSGDPSRITEKGKEQLVALGIRKIFDFRAAQEIKDYSSATPVIAGIETVRVPIISEQQFDPVSIALQMKEFAENELETHLKISKDMLEAGAAGYTEVFRYILEHPEEPCLVHCTAGKDRTGVFTALLLTVLGVTEEDICYDYALTTVGLEPFREVLMAKFQKIEVYRDNWQGLVNLGSSKPETMKAILEMIKAEYGGAEEYLRKNGFTTEDIQKIRDGLVVPTPSS